MSPTEWTKRVIIAKLLPSRMAFPRLWMTQFFSSPVDKELVTSSAHPFSPAWGCAEHADFQTLT
jgi:hypothetical protein